MNTIAATIVENDMVILELWLRYYSKWFKDLYVLGNDTKKDYGELQPLKEKYHFRFERTPYLPHPPHVLEVVKNLQKRIFENFDWMMWSNCDEFVVTDPRKYRDLKDFMERYPEDKCLCEGFEVYQEEDEKPLDYSKPILQQRKYWFKDVCYNKPLLSKVPINWAEGFHRELEVPDTIGKEAKDTGLYLAHLKYADPTPEGNRDFGPTFSNINWDVVKEGKKVRQEIPEEIRRLF